MDLFALKLFRDIAAESSFVKAAKINFLTQPAVSFHIKKLEEELQVKLFDRVSRKAILTREGGFLLPVAENILQQCENIKTRLKDFKQAPIGEVRVATIYSIGVYELTPFLKTFIRTYPQINIQLQYLRSDVIHDLVLKNSIDLGIVAYPKAMESLEIVPLGTDTLVLIAPPQHPLAARKSIRLEEIRGENFVAFDNNIPTGEKLNQALAYRGVEVNVRMKNENIDTLKRSVEVGLGVSIVPKKTITAEVQQKRLAAIEIRDLPLERPLGAIVKKGRILNYPAQIFLQMLVQKYQTATS